MKYPGKNGYHYPAGPSHNSPCMSSYWRDKPIYQGKTRDEEIDHEEKPEEAEDETEQNEI